MIDIEKLQPGDIVRHVESGNVYTVTVVHPISKRVYAVREIEITHDDEWILIPPPPRKKRDRAAELIE